MKIGILTYHSVPNFGANLQALSTQGYLIKVGHEPIIINWVPEDLELAYNQGRIPSVQYDVHRKFTKNNLIMTVLCRNDEDIVRIVHENNIEGIIIGSDAVWCHTPNSRRRVFSYRKMKFVTIKTISTRTFPNPFWGSFLKLGLNIPVCVFSASSQNMPFAEVKGELKNNIGESLKQFKYITVRDEWTKDLVSYFTNDTVVTKVTPDPVFAFNENTDLGITKQKILEKFGLPEKYILISFRISRVNKRWVKKFEKECSKQGLICVGFPMPEGLISFDLNHNIDIPLDPIDWYYLIKYSSGYIGERMHPVIVSLHNCIPFYCFDEYGTFKNIRFRFLRKHIKESSKIFDILNRVNLTTNRFSYNTKTFIPSPAKVLNKLKSFDVSECASFITNQEINYKTEMDIVIEHLMAKTETS